MKKQILFFFLSFAIIFFFCSRHKFGNGLRTRLLIKAVLNLNQGWSIIYFHGPLKNLNLKQILVLDTFLQRQMHYRLKHRL